MFYIQSVFNRLVRFLFPPKCYKEQMGYTCHHRVYKDGYKECGK